MTTTGSNEPTTKPWKIDNINVDKDSAVALAESNGAEMVDFDFRIIPSTFLPVNSDGAWLLPGNSYSAASTFSINSLTAQDTDELLIRVHPRIFNSSENTVAVIAHEMFELRKILEVLVREHVITGRRLAELVNAGIVDNFHWQAWGYADGLIDAMRLRAKLADQHNVLPSTLSSANDIAAELGERNDN